ncbi:MAG: hypothetical protein NUV84_03190, partial [Candidatus Uhrbacteria bacterium]|nr:hypothetical protein [Candidatus Uhrbacteria bacterium]
SPVLMTRMEKQAGIEKRLDEVKTEMTSEIRRRTRRSHPWLTCSLILLAVLVGVCVWGLWITAATGLVRVPVFTYLAYEVPVPTRSVTPGVPVEAVLKQAFTSTLTRRLYEGGGTLSNRLMSVQLEESSLTASWRSLLEEGNLDWIDVSGSGVVVDPDVGVEVFVPILGSELKTAITFTFDLSAQEGNLVVTPTKIQVGKARIPNFLIVLFLKPLLEAELAKLNAAMIGYTKISTIEIFPRAVSISGELSVEIENAL